MNAASRVIHQSRFFQGDLLHFNLPTSLVLQVLLLVFVLANALSCVYMVHLHRVTCSHLQAEVYQSHQLELQWGQLLLEQASLAAPARVEKLAGEKLHMVFPTHQNTFVLKAE